MKRDGQPVMKPFWEITPAEVEKLPGSDPWYPANMGYFRGGGYSSGFLTRGGMPVTMMRLNLVKGLGPVLQLAEGWTVDLPEMSTRRSTSAPIPPGRPTGLSRA